MCKDFSENFCGALVFGSYTANRACSPERNYVLNLASFFMRRESIEMPPLGIPSGRFSNTALCKCTSDCRARFPLTYAYTPRRENCM